jgi:hypothetical protein
MKWDLNEPESITTARLLSASPEYVYEQLAFYGNNSKSKSFLAKKQAELSLLKRNDPLINLALAKYCCSQEVLHSLYSSASADNSSTDYNDYYAGLRTACLSNKNEIFSKWRNFDFSELILSAANEISNYLADTKSKNNDSKIELYALLDNPTIDEDLLASLFEKTGLFETMDNQVWEFMVQAASHNLRLMKDDSDEWGPDMGAYSIQKGVCSFLEKVPISPRSFYIVSSMMVYLDASRFHKPNNAKLIIERWLGATNLDEKLSEDGGNIVGVSPREELACQLSALLGGEKLAANKLSAKFQNSTKQKIIRCSEYGTKLLSPKKIDKAFKVDRQLFITCALMNNELLEKEELRSVIERHLNTSTAYMYIKRLENINKVLERSKLAPITEEFFTENEIFLSQNPQFKTIENKLRRLEKEIIKRVDSSNNKIIILFILVILILYLVWK